MEHQSRARRTPFAPPARNVLFPPERRSISHFCSTISFYTFAVFLKPLSEEFAWSREAVSSAYGVMALAAAISAPAIGHLLDRLGTRRVVLPCITLSGCAFASLAALTPRLSHLYAVFAVLDVAAALMLTRPA